MDEKIVTCARSACQREIKDLCYEIWSLGTDQPRIYCPDCGRKIIEYNPTLRFIRGFVGYPRRESERT